MATRPVSGLGDRLGSVAREGTIILTQASCGYLELADNWISHAEALGVSNWVTVAQDTTAFAYLTEK